LCQSPVFQHSGRKVYEFRNDTKKKMTITFHEMIVKVIYVPLYRFMTFSFVSLRPRGIILLFLKQDKLLAFCNIIHETDNFRCHN